MMRVEPCILYDNCYSIMAIIDSEPAYCIGTVDENGTFFPKRKVYDAREAFYICKGIEEITKLQNAAKREVRL